MKTNHKVIELEPQDDKIVDLIKKLKNVDDTYPSGMLTARRQSFINQIVGTGVSLPLDESVKPGSGTGFPPITTGLALEAVLIVAIVAESLVLAYMYRDKLADTVKNLVATPAVQEVTSPPVSTFSFPTIETSAPVVTAVPTQTVSAIATDTPIPFATEGLSVSNTGVPTFITSTPIPKATHGNNGNHYGQTPKPERTKDNNKDKPPKEDPGNGNKDKPPKEKDKNK